ncbi:ComF family protein [Leucobacter insecticola]|uniref:ComF family protein n=1 Tax=Leucobacter insecticola TaxID=2714934 RepID=A0A6G8FHR7_9MICO|nr:phosphoribosyltransferase family protein [Leucobacter insecticola]QIM15898.1 ComF family protein [Leucobacter insecticola]
MNNRAPPHSSISATLRELLLDLLAILWPTECVNCGAPDRDCCTRCRKELRRPGVMEAAVLGVPSYTAGVYEGPARALLVAFKHGGRVRFARPLAERLRDPLLLALGHCGKRVPLLVTIPSRPAQTRARGFRHVNMLVRLSLRTEKVQHLSALRTLRGRTGQVGLSPADRERNASRIAVRRSAARVLRGREVVLVDDVMTTGASLRAAREVLQAAGAEVVAIAVLCVALRRDTR